MADVEDKGPGRQALFEEIAGLAVPGDYPRFFQRWRSSLEALPETQTAVVTVHSRMAVGLGAESILETSIALHRTYGVPYIPGSALKGLAAAAAHKHLEDPSWRKAGEDGKIRVWHRILFGDQESSGYVTFHDALWIPNGDKLPLDLDVMTVHHPDYYQGTGSPPADWDSPVPVAFLSARGQYLLAATGPEEWLKAAMAILADALEKDGIGAKTAAGYGRMKIDRPPEPEKLNWKELLKTLQMGTADQIVPRILDRLKGEELRTAVAAMIVKLDRREVRRRRDKEWAQRLLEAEGG
ncbi:MAG: type III-B CRISPR module RAMP protein Cmr6 [Thermoanaerobaculia bacterium]